MPFDGENHHGREVFDPTGAVMRGPNDETRFSHVAENTVALIRGTRV